MHRVAMWRRVAGSRSREVEESSRRQAGIAQVGVAQAGVAQETWRRQAWRVARWALPRPCWVSRRAQGVQSDGRRQGERAGSAESTRGAQGRPSGRRLASDAFGESVDGYFESKPSTVTKRCVTVSPVTACHRISRNVLLRAVTEGCKTKRTPTRGWLRTDRSRHGGVASGVVSVLLLSAETARN